jgi:hypothetical protein
MIELQVKDYSQNCPEFEPHIRKVSGYANDVIIHSETTISCKYALKCERMRDYIKKEDLK